MRSLFVYGGRSPATVHPGAAHDEDPWRTRPFRRQRRRRRTNSTRRYADIDREMQAYLNYDADVLRGKIFILDEDTNKSGRIDIDDQK